MIYLSSFFGPGQGPRYSIARWAPRTFTGNHDTLSWLGARGLDGHALRHLPPEDFKVRYYRYLLTRFDQLYAWLDSLDPSQDMTLCCWCTPARQHPHPQLYCHRILVGYVIEERRPDIPVAYVGGAENPIWPRPEVMRSAGCPHSG